MKEIYIPYISHSGKGHDDNPPGRGSGRYAWGVGEKPYQHLGLPKFTTDFLEDEAKVKEKLGANATRTEVAKAMGMSSGQYDAYRGYAHKELWFAKRAAAIELCKTHSQTEVAKILGEKSESNIRTYLNDEIAYRQGRVRNTAAELRKMVDGGDQYVGIGSGVPALMGVPQTTFDSSIKALEVEGYKTHVIELKQINNPANTTKHKVLTKGDVTKRDVYANLDKIKYPGVTSTDKGLNYLGQVKPKSVSSDRIGILYGPDGGTKKDGLIELRRGVPDISMGEQKYAQVRIAVDDKYYLKGMAVYSDKLPKGVDIVFNTNKENTGKKTDAMKKMEIDPKTGKVDWENPFKSTIKTGSDLKYSSRFYTDKDGKKQQSAINIVNEQDEWSKWATNDTLPTQFLAKQPPALIQSQLKQVSDSQKARLKDIMSISNNTIKGIMLNNFAESCDKQSVHLKAAGLPRQTASVILPGPNVKEGEVFAPNYKNGEKIALVRYPHGGKFEIPILTVNNNNPMAKKMIGADSTTAIGIHHTTAEQLSGADFDGDTVTCMPLNSRINIKSQPAVKSLIDFEPKVAYKGFEGMKVISKKDSGTEMGKITNLITDMTMIGAPVSDVVDAVKFSMVAIDAHKHKLNIKQAEKDFHIKELKKKYRGSANAGASTLLSRSTSPTYILDRVEKRVSEMTPAEYKQWKEGYKIYKNTNKLSRGRDGLYTPRVQEVDALSLPNTNYTIAKVNKLTKDEYNRYLKGDKTVLINKNSQSEEAKRANMKSAFDLTSGGSKKNPGYLPEALYAKHSDELKEMARLARKEARNLPSDVVDLHAKKQYKDEVESIKNKLKTKEINSIKEKQATIDATLAIRENVRTQDYPDKKEYTKMASRVLAASREKYGKEKYKVSITDKELSAIEAHAITKTDIEKLVMSMDDASLERFQNRIVSKNTKTGLTPGQQALIKSKLKTGMYTQQEIADSFGVSLSTIRNIINS